MRRVLLALFVLPALAAAQPPAADGVLEAAEVMPELIGGMEALASQVAYPEDARRAAIEGQVVVRFVVDERGEVTVPEVLRSPSPLLSEAALAAVRGVRFTARAEGIEGRVCFSSWSTPTAPSSA